jgi:hypothetical protein
MITVRIRRISEILPSRKEMQRESMRPEQQIPAPNANSAYLRRCEGL